MPQVSIIDRLLRRDRILVIGGLSAAVVLSWAWLLLGAGMDTQSMGAMGEMATGGRSAADLAVLVVMWAVMMAAMMLPSAAPMILFYAGITRRRQERGEIATGTSAFASGYLVLWSAFSLGAALLQWELQSAALLSPAMATTSVMAAGLLLIAAGAYQFSPLKQACLRRCRSPLEFVLTEWREGRRGAVIMGMRHGIFCLGCCWALMLLLFVGGVMNLAWIGGLALFVLLEKTAPAGGLVSRAAGAVLVIAGVAVLLPLA